MTDEYNTRTKKEAVVSNEALTKVEENIMSTMNCLKEEIINLKDIVIKRLQEEKKKLREKCSKLENDVVSNESSVNALEQYGRRNNIVVSGIPGHVSERDLEETVISVLSDIEVNVSADDVEACYKIGRPDRNKSKKIIIVRFLNRKHCKKALLNRRNWKTWIKKNIASVKTLKSSLMKT